ncbi:multidrug efflux MFS transporter [Saccharopolyspora sp. HNM0983]|uniref:Multidrug efflux MFS transporter n=1 Tax=Saccharopolyspora montiporae TaxID=2781240 RepID=A0A929B767_9PSEU|nr:multidrug efflux MFS transporter [Saccharopolyspora sp. HNM0983]
MRRIEYKWLVGITFVLGLIMQILDVTILNVALATLGREFDVGEATLQWVLTGYVVSLAVFIPSAGWIADRFGSKRTFQTAVVVFTLASVLCGAATEMWVLIAARVLQGVGGGMLVPVGQAMLFRAFPTHERAKAGAVLAIPTTVAPALGPVLGGVLVEHASWRWIFFINVPVGALALLCTVLFLREEPRSEPGRFDLPGFLLAGGGLATLLFGLDRVAHLGWSDVQVTASLAVSAVLLAALVRRELAVRAPVLDVRLLGERMFAAGNAVLMCQMGTLFGVVFLVPLYLQDVRAMPPSAAGLVLMPQALSMLLVTQVVGALYPRIGPKRLLLAGFGLQAVLVLGFRLSTAGSPVWLLVCLLVGQGVAMGLLTTPVQTATFARIGPAQLGQASSMFNAGRQVGTALGTAVVATVLAAFPDSSTVDSGAAYGAALLAPLGFALLGFAISLRVRDSDAAPTMRADPAEEHAPPGEPVHAGTVR